MEGLIQKAAVRLSPVADPRRHRITPIIFPQHLFRFSMHSTKPGAFVSPKVVSTQNTVDIDIIYR